MNAQLVARRPLLRFPFVEESKVFSLFQISLQSYFDLKAAMLKYTHCQPSELERMPFYEIEIILDSLKELAEKEEEERKKKEKKDSSSMPNLNQNSMMRNMQNSMPKMPNFKL